jgi:GT2 family glycosyltransferase
MTKISAVVPVWNGRALLERLLDSLERQTRPAAELVAIDNGSSDGAPELARARGARVIAMGHNAGFAAAANRGIGECRCEWIAVLNTDVELEADYFEQLLRSAERERAWFATGKILAKSEKLTPAGMPVPLDATFDLLARGGTVWRAGNRRADGPVFSAPRRIWSAPWTAALFRAELFGRVGLLETAFESYLEDVDFGVRCAMQSLDGLYVPAALAWHAGSASLGRWHPETVRRIARNQVFLIARHYPRAIVLRYLWPILTAQMLWGAVAMRHGAGRAWLRGKWQGLGGWRDARAKHSAADPAELERFLRENERVIREIQTATGFDVYWRMYFLLTGGEAK